MRLRLSTTAQTTVAIAAAVLLIGCSHKDSKGGAPMSQGEKLYRANCASCHRLLSPDEHDGPTWKTYIEKYGKRLSADEKKLVFDFLTGQTSPEDVNQRSDSP